MKLRVALLALALAFLAAPALGALAAAGCPPCGEMTQNGAPCALTAASCCGDVAPAAPVKTTPELPTAYAIAAVTFALPRLAVRAPNAAAGIADTTASLRLSVVRRL